MSDNVIESDIITLIDLPPERVLNAAIKADLDRAMILGLTKDGELYVAASFADVATMIYLMERYKHEMLAGDYG